MGRGVVVGLGDSVEDLGGEDFVLEEGGRRWDGGGKKEEKCCEKTETLLVFSGRREVGREGMWDQEGAEREN